MIGGADSYGRRCRYRFIADSGSWLFPMPMPMPMPMPLPKTKAELATQTRPINGFMAWKSADAYVVSSQRTAPDAIFSVAVDRSQVLALARPISFKPLAVGANHPLPVAVIGSTITSFLPAAGAVADPALIAENQRVFGPTGTHAVEQVTSTYVV